MANDHFQKYVGNSFKLDDKRSWDVAFIELSNCKIEFWLISKVWNIPYFARCAYNHAQPRIRDLSHTILIKN